MHQKFCYHKSTVVIPNVSRLDIESCSVERNVSIWEAFYRFHFVSDKGLVDEATLSQQKSRFSEEKNQEEPAPEPVQSKVNKVKIL